MKPMNTLKLLSIATFASTSMFFTSCGEKKDAETEANNEAQEAEASTAAQQAEDTLGSLTDELIIQLNQYADTVLSVKDTATANDAIGNLDKIGDAIGAIAARLNKIDMPDEATNIAVDEKMKSASNAIKQKMQAAGQIMSNQEVAGILIPALQNFGMRMAEHEKVFMRFGKQKDQSAPQQPAAEQAAPAAATSEAPAAAEAPVATDAPAAAEAPAE
jgi:ribosomal 50S subunit-associated protein YjgA (DUF615 family)